MTDEQPTEDIVEKGNEDLEGEEGEEAKQDSSEEGQVSSPPESAALPTEVENLKMPELKALLEQASADLETTSLPDFIQSLSPPTDIYQQAAASAKLIGKEFVESATDLAETMRLILTFDQLVLKKLNQSTAFDYGVKPKTDEETKAIMINRAGKMLEVGQEQYEASHDISTTAQHLRDLRLEACDNVNSVHSKLLAVHDAELIFKTEAQAALAEEARLAAEEEARLAVEAAAAAAEIEADGGAPATETNS